MDASPTDAGAVDAEAPDAEGQADADGGSGTDWFYGTDCPPGAPSSLPPESPRILVLAPTGMALPLADMLHGLLAGDPTFVAPEVVGQETLAMSQAALYAGQSLMNFFYQPEGRDERLAWFATPGSYVVLLEDESFASGFPEIYFEGVRTLGCAARAAGAQPIVLTSLACRSAPGASPDAASMGELSYRVANGTNSIVAPAGYAREAMASPTPAPGPDGGMIPVRTCDGPDLFVAAATVYSTLTGRDAAGTSYQPPGMAADLVAQLGGLARDTVVAEAARVHYQDPFHGAVEVRMQPPGGDFWFMDSGTSSEQIWFDRMNEILPRAGFAPQGTQIGYTNPQKLFDSACLDNAAPYFQTEQYRILFARGYSVDAATIAAAGVQTDLQVQVWDRHADSDDSAGLAALGMMEGMSMATSEEARQLGLAMTPYHLMFSKLKTMRPSVDLLSDGTHATYPVGYGLATMSVVSRTGLHPSTDGLDADTSLAATLAEETIRQLASLSVTGAFVPDDPTARPTPVTRRRPGAGR